jgi:collagen type VII alpha
MQSRLVVITFPDPGEVLVPGQPLPPVPGHPGNALPGAPVYPSGGPVFPGGPVDPGYGRPGWSPVDPGYGGGRPNLRPDNGLPVGPPGSIGTLPVFPFDPTIDNSLPGSGGRPDNSLPGSGGRPDNSLPGSGGRPDNSLPGAPVRPGNALPPTGIVPGLKFTVKWLACVGLILVPDNSLPGGGSIDNSLPETPEPK